MMRFSSYTSRVSVVDKHLTELGNEELIFFPLLLFLRGLARKGNCEAELCDSENEITSQ